MIDGFSPARDILEDHPMPRECRNMAHALTAEGCTVSELAYLLGTSRLTAWWLSDYRAENDSGAPPRGHSRTAARAQGRRGSVMVAS
jgi:hypothetical protein